MAGGVFADRLMHQAQGKLPRLEGARVVGFGRAAGADIAHLRALELGEAAAAGEGVPIEALVGMAPDKGPYLARQVERLGLVEHGHERLPAVRFVNFRRAPRGLKQNPLRSVGPVRGGSRVCRLLWGRLRMI